MFVRKQPSSVHLLQIQEVHLGPHSNAWNFCHLYLYFSYLSYLGHPSFLGLQTKTRRSIEQLFYFLLIHNPETSMSSAVKVFVHAICEHLKKCLVQEVAHFGSPGWIPMIQPPLIWVALQYEIGTKISAWVVPELHTGKNWWKFTWQILVYMYEHYCYGANEWQHSLYSF